MAYYLAARFDELWDGEMLGITLEGQKILLIRMDGEVYAYENRCAHLGVMLSEGRLADGVLTCAAHEWRYDARTGCGINPKTAILRRYPVRIQGDDIWVAVDEEGERKKEEEERNLTR